MHKSKVKATVAARKQGRAREVRHTGKGEGAGTSLLFKDRPPVTHFLQLEPSTFYKSHQFPKYPWFVMKSLLATWPLGDISDPNHET